MRRLLPVLIGLGSITFLSAQNWSPWKQDAVFHGIEVRERCEGFNEFANRFVWDVQLRNTYDKNVDLAWAAEPAVLHGSEAQADHAVAVKPGEIVEAHHTATSACNAALPLRVNGVQTSGAAPVAAGHTAAPTAPPSGSVGSSFHPKLEGRWASKDPEPQRKQLVVSLSGKTVTGSFTSPNFSFQISSPLPEGVSGSVSLERGDQK